MYKQEKSKGNKTKVQIARSSTSAGTGESSDVLNIVQVQRLILTLK